MWWAGCSFELFLSQRAATLHGPNGLAVSTSGDDWASVLDALDTASADLPRHRLRRSLRVLLSIGLVRPFVFEQIQGVTDRAEAQQIARTMAPEAAGLRGPCEVSLHDWRCGMPCLASAVEQGLIQRLTEWTQIRNMRLRAVCPWWIRPVNDLIRRKPLSPAAAVRDDDGLIVLSGFEASAANVLGYWPAPATQERVALIERTALTHGCSVDDLPCATWVPRAAFNDGEDDGAGTATGRVHWERRLT